MENTLRSNSRLIPTTKKNVQNNIGGDAKTPVNKKVRNISA